MTKTKSDDKRRCPEYVSDPRGWSGHTCKRPLKTDEQREAGLCGIHLAAKRRREANDARNAERERAAEGRRAAAKATCDRLAALGIRARPEFDTHRPFIDGWTGRIVVDDPEELLRLLNNVEKKKEPKP